MKKELRSNAENGLTALAKKIKQQKRVGNTQLLAKRKWNTTKQRWSWNVDQNKKIKALSNILNEFIVCETKENKRDENVDVDKNSVWK